MTGKKLRRNKEIKGEKESKEDMSEGRKEEKSNQGSRTGHVSNAPLQCVCVCCDSMRHVS